MVWLYAYILFNIHAALPGCEYTTTTVICQGQNITEMPENISASVMQVHIKHADINILNTSSLQQTENLVELHVESSGLTDIMDDAFQDLKFLKMISLKGNQLKSLKKGLFCNLTALKVLHLNENQLVSIDGAFEGLSGLEKLFLNDNQISYISTETFKNLLNLHQLDLNNNNIKDIQPGAFDGMKKLILLGLGANPLTRIDNVFPPAMKLQYLNMTACMLTTFPSDLPSSLKYLELTKNKIKQIFKSDTELYVHLNALILEENGLTFVEPGSFSKMTALAEIFLFVNDLEKFPGPFPASIMSIYLDNNKIASIPPDMFKTGTRLNKLSIRINNITSLSPNAFQNTEYIKEIHLERNPFTVLHDDTFKLAKRLNYLDLNRLTLTAIYPDCFLGLDSLIKLEMSFVKVLKNQVHGNIFRNLPMLEELELQESPTLAEIFLTNLIIEHKKITTIRKLNLEDNSLESLSENIQTYLPNLQKLSLRGNKLNCNVNLLWLRNWHSIEPEKFHKFNQVRCHMPRHLQGQRVQDVRIEEFFHLEDTSPDNDSQVISSSDTATYGSALYDTNQDSLETTSHYPYVYQEYEYYFYDDNISYAEITTEVIQKLSTSHVLDKNLIQSNDTDNDEGKNTRVTNHTPPQTDGENSTNLKTVGIAFGMAVGVIILMLTIALIVFKVWQRKRNDALQTSCHENGGQEYVFISTNTERLDKQEPKVHRKMSRAERGSTTSRASEDITNHTDTNMKVYTLDVDT